MNDSGTGHAVFETTLGWIGLAWAGDAVSHLHLPEADEAKTAARIAAKSKTEPAPMPPHIERIARKVMHYAAGERIDFSDVPLVLDEIDEFRKAIYAQSQRLGYGETTTYGALAAAAGYAGLARETGQALGANPIPIIVPCHRILAAGGKMGGFSAPGGVSTKRRLLDMEHARPPSPQGQTAFTF